MAIRYRFATDFDYPVDRNTDVAYKAGTEILIPDAHADKADAAGAGERLGEPSPRKAPPDAERG